MTAIHIELFLTESNIERMQQTVCSIYVCRCNPEVVLVGFAVQGCVDAWMVTVGQLFTGICAACNSGERYATLWLAIMNKARCWTRTCSVMKTYSWPSGKGQR